MSNIYITEPNTEGKVLLHTTFGDLDIELWPQQAPKACRNFVQLCLEGYYDNTPFHRIIAGFMVQGGDPTGTGKGGESIYGSAFIDEFHSRLRFNHRGLLAMANENKPNSNHSQFFFTLDACEFLEKKHTIFGKITGNTIFNLLSIGNIETEKDDRPLNPPKFLSAEVLWNPFDDIVPRKIKKPTAIDEAAAKKKKRNATKNLNLLSFGDEEEESVKTSKKINIASSHDLLQDKKLSKKVDEAIVQSIKEAIGSNSNSNNSSSKPNESAEKKLSSFKARIEAAMQKKEGKSKVETTEQQQEDKESEEKKAKTEKKKRKAEAQNENNRDEYTKLREELRKSRAAANVIVGEKAKELDKAKAYHDMLTPLQQQRQKYLAKKKSSNASRQSDTLKKLASFQQKLSQASQEARTNGSKTEENSTTTKESYHGQVFSEDSGAEDEAKDDKSWMTAKLKFKKHIDDQYRAGFDPSTDDYMTIDTRTAGDPVKKERDYSSRDKGGDRHRRDSGRRREYDREGERR